LGFIYKINPASYSGVFVLPAELADRHLKLAGTVHLKTLIYIYRNAGRDIGLDELSKAAGFSAHDIADALNYWVENGFILQNEAEGGKNASAANTVSPAEQNILPERAPAAKNSETPRKTLPPITPPRPTALQIAARIKESGDVKELLNESQKILGRTVGYDTQAVLLMLHDHYGLPTAVILMICQYARGQNKANSMNYITAVAKDWAEREINNFDKAVEELDRIQSADRLWAEFIKGTGLPKTMTKKQKTFFTVWTAEWKFPLEILLLAYEDTVDNTGAFKIEYMNRILKDWHDKNFMTPEEILNDKAEWQKKKARGKQKSEKTAKGADKADISFDIKKAEEKAKFGTLVHKKRNEK